MGVGQKSHRGQDWRRYAVRFAGPRLRRWDSMGPMSARKILRLTAAVALAATWSIAAQPGARREFPSRLIYNHAEAMKRLVWLLMISTLALHAQQGKKKAQKKAQDNPEGPQIVDLGQA